MKPTRDETWTEPEYTLPSLEEHQGWLLLKVKVQPGASRERFAGLHGDALKIAVTAPPERGKANAQVQNLLARALGIRGSQVQLHSGEKSRDKRFRLDGLTLEEARARLAKLLSAAS